MIAQLHKREFLMGLVSLIAAPAIVRASSLMPVKSYVEIIPYFSPLQTEEAMRWIQAEMSRQIAACLQIPLDKLLATRVPEFFLGRPSCDQT